MCTGGQRVFKEKIFSLSPAAQNGTRLESASRVLLSCVHLNVSLEAKCEYMRYLMKLFPLVSITQYNTYLKVCDLLYGI